MVGLRFTILNETPCAEPHAGCCGGWRLDTSGYPIKLLLLIETFPCLIKTVFEIIALIVLNVTFNTVATNVNGLNLLRYIIFGIEDIPRNVRRIIWAAASLGENAFYEFVVR